MHDVQSTSFSSETSPKTLVYMTDIERGIMAKEYLSSIQLPHAITDCK
jgi:hypothetical protein